MIGIYTGIACAMAPVPGVFLRLTAFMGDVSAGRRFLLKFISVVWIALNFILFLYIGSRGRIDIRFYKLELLGFGIVTTASYILITGKYFREQIFTFGLVALLVTIVYAAAAFIVGQLSSRDMDSVLLFGNILGFAIFMALYPLFRKIIVDSVVPFLGLETGNYWNAMWPIPLTMLFATLLTTRSDRFITTPAELAGRIFIGAATLLLCRSVSEDYRRLRERETLLDQVGQQKEHYEAMAEKVRAERKARHNFKHQLAAVQSLIDDGNLEELKRYCGEAEGSLEDISNAPHTGNSAADSLLYHYASLAASEGISFSVSGTFGEAELPDGDVICLLGNALDNAMTAVKTAEGEKYIETAVMEKDGQLMITVDNAFDGIVLEENGKFYSRKRRHAEGIGISSMREIVEKHGGMSRFQADGTRFEASFLLDAGGGTKTDIKKGLLH